MRLRSYFDRYSNISRKPRFFHLLYVLPSLIRRGPAAFKEFTRFVRANNLPQDRDILNDGFLPEIEIFIAAIEKDFWLLPQSISLAVQNSNNPVARITVVTQNQTVEKCKEVIGGLKLGIPVEVHSEDAQLDSRFRERLHIGFGNRYGWALQQFLTVNFVLNSPYKGVLAINADTLIIRQQTWLTHDAQVLMVSSEHHSHYYELLTLLGLPCLQPKYTFVTHHMVFSPTKFSSILHELHIQDINDLLEKIIVILSVTKSESICIEFELYAQGLRKFFPEYLILKRFGNLGISARTFSLNSNQKKALNPNTFEGYNSLSIHSWS